MPKNKGKGGKNRRRGKNENDNEKRELIFKEVSFPALLYHFVQTLTFNGRKDKVGSFPSLYHDSSSHIGGTTADT